MKLTIKQAQILELVKSAGQEGAEDMMVVIGWADSHAKAARIIKSVLDFANSLK